MAIPLLPVSVASSEVGVTLAKLLEEQYGQRWPVLLDALFTDGCQKVHLRNTFIQQAASSEHRRVLSLGPVRLVEPSPNADDTPIRHTASGLLTHYSTYIASVLPAFVLGITPNSSVLWLGLPPTGRMLAVIQLLSPQPAAASQQAFENSRQLPLSWEECGEGPPPEGWTDAEDTAVYSRRAEGIDPRRQPSAAPPARSTFGGMVEALMHRSIRAGCCMVKTSSGDWSELEAVPGNPAPADNHTLLSPFKPQIGQQRQAPDPPRTTDEQPEQPQKVTSTSQPDSLIANGAKEGDRPAQITCVLPSECGWSQRIERVLPHHVPGIARHQIRTVYKKGSSWWKGLGAERYDCALIEAPCCATREAVVDKLRSGSRDPWPQEPEDGILQDQQHLLIAAFQALKPGRTLIYSTASLAAQENDRAVLQAVAALGDSAEILDEPASKGLDASLLKQWGAEKTSYGWIFLPDASFQGPTYFSLLRKRGQSAEAR